MSYVTLNFNGLSYSIPAPGDKSANWGALINTYLQALAGGAAALNVANEFTAPVTFDLQAVLDHGAALVPQSAPSQSANLQIYCNTGDGNLYALLPTGHSAVPVNLSGTNQLAPPYAAKTSNYAILAGDNTTRFSNQGATNTVTLTLPTATAGLEFYFTCSAPYQLTVARAGGANILVPGGTSGTSVTVYGAIAANQYTSFRLACVDGSNWVLGALTGNVNVP